MATDLLRQMRAEALAALRPPVSMPTAEWIEANMVLPSNASATPGKVKLWAYQRGICDALDDPEIERISVLKSARVGYTALLTGIIAAAVATDPQPILAVQPTSDDARDYSVDVESVFEASPALRGLLSDEFNEAGRSTLLNRRFPGGSLKFVAAKSPRNLRRHTAKLLILDEIDGYESNAEGNPIDLAVMRTLTFRDRKILAGSTPVFDYGPSTALYGQSDQRIFEVPCPECGEFHEIQWSDIQWPEGEPEKARYCCPSCGCLIDETRKPAMVAGGRWRATAPHVKGHAGFRINALVSPHWNARWSKLAQEFLIAKRTPEALQTFTNLVLGQPWATGGDDLDDRDLYARREAFSLDAIPEDVLFITVGVDCQHDRLEAVIMGHGESDLWILDHVVFWGPIDGDSVWADLDALLTTRWPHPLGGTIGVDACAVDAGDGGQVDRITDFCRPKFGRRVVPIKGVPGFSRPFIAKTTSAGKHLWLVGVDAVKTQLFNRLHDMRGIHFGESLAPVYFEQLTSEKRVMRYTRGKPEARFERIPGKRAETLDATGYAWAVRNLIGQKLEARQAEVASAAAPKRAPAVIRSRWMAR